MCNIPIILLFRWRFQLAHNLVIMAEMKDTRKSEKPSDTEQCVCVCVCGVHTGGATENRKTNRKQNKMIT